MTILDKIIENKKKELKASDEVVAVRDLENSRLFSREVISLSESLLDKSKTGIIAEFKRKSPSKGIINSLSAVEEVTSGYFMKELPVYQFLLTFNFSVVQMQIL